MREIVVIAAAGWSAGVAGICWGIRNKISEIGIKKEISILKRMAADRKEQKEINEKVNFELQSYINTNMAFRKFHHSWNNGTGYMNGLVSYDFRGISRYKPIYSICPATARMVVVFSRAGKDGQNVVYFKRYSEYDSTLWVAQFDDGFLDIEKVDGEIHSEGFLKALKKKLAEDND